MCESPLPAAILVTPLTSQIGGDDGTRNPRPPACKVDSFKTWAAVGGPPRTPSAIDSVGDDWVAIAGHKYWVELFWIDSARRLSQYRT